MGTHPSNPSANGHRRNLSGTVRRSDMPGWLPRLEVSERWMIASFIGVSLLAFLIVVVMLGVAGS